MAMSYTTPEAFLDYVRERNGNEPEFLQAVEEFAHKVIPFIAAHPKYQNKSLLERMVEPERIITFRVCWIDDKGVIQVNRGFRIQMNSAIGPYKGGLRFHPSVNLSILKFLGFEQTFKNSLTTLPMGGGKGGSDFDPKGKSDNEVMRFCQAFMVELSKYIGADRDVPAGDIGVGGREIGFLFGQYKRLRNEFTGVLTGKGIDFGGSLIRREATGYGTVYFAASMLGTRGDVIKGKTVTVSGSGNVAQYAVQMCNIMGAKVVTMSDSGGFVHDADGFTPEKLAFVTELKDERRGRIAEYVKEYPTATFHAGARPWGIKCDVALPCATQNELDGKDAEALLANGVTCVAEGANMPSTIEAISVFTKARILYAPGKASNAGGVATSGLEMSQNSAHLSWTADEVQARLKNIMLSIHASCVAYGKTEGDDGSYIDYVKGANIAGFVKVADAMLAQGCV